MLNGNALWVFHARDNSSNFPKRMCVWSNKAIIIMIIMKKSASERKKFIFIKKRRLGLHSLMLAAECISVNTKGHTG